MKRIKKILIQWSRKVVGDFFQKAVTLEDVIKVTEIQLEMDPCPENREALNKAEAELKKYRHIKKEYWKQKAGIKWFEDGDHKTKFFHAYVKG